MEGKEIPSPLPTIVSYCCKLSGAEAMSAVRHKAPRRQACITCHSSYQNNMKGRESSSIFAAETIDTRKKLVERQADAASLSRGAYSTREQELQSGIADFLSQQSVAEWPPFLEEMCRGDGVVVEGLYSTCMFEPLHSLRLLVPRLSKLCLVQCSSFHKMFTPLGIWLESGKS